MSRERAETSERELVLTLSAYSLAVSLAQPRSGEGEFSEETVFSMFQPDLVLSPPKECLCLREISLIHYFL